MVRDEAIEDLLEYVRSWVDEAVQAEDLQEAEGLGVEVGRLVGQAITQGAVGRFREASNRGSSFHTRTRWSW